MTILGVDYPWYWVANPKEMEKKVFFPHGCVEGHLLCLLKGGQIWSNCFFFTFNLNTYGQWNHLVFSK